MEKEGTLTTHSIRPASPGYKNQTQTVQKKREKEEVRKKF